MKTSALQIFVVALLALGLLLWLIALARGRALEWFTAPSRLPPWVPMLGEFLVFLLAVMVGSLVATESAIWLFKIDRTIDPVPARTALISSYAMQGAWLAVALTFRLMGMLRAPPGETRTGAAAIAGATAFLLAMPAVTLVTHLWEALLVALKVPAPPQTAIDMIRQANTPGEFLPWLLLVAVFVPVAEEVLFRFALYRFLAARLPDAGAMVISAGVFALLHGNALSVFPLTVFGVALCLAYRYTGRLITPIIMHALFNLTSLILVKLQA